MAVKVWALVAFSSVAHVKRKNAIPSAACYAMSREALPFGGWTRQGFGVEVARLASPGEARAFLKHKK